MTTTTCPICEVDAEASPITGDFQGFDCLAHRKFEVSGNRDHDPRAKRHPGMGESFRARPSPSRERQPAPRYGQRFLLNLAPDHHRKRHDLRRQAIAYETWLAVGIGLATGTVLLAAGFAFAKLLGL